ncbi:hypothetical protein G9A89_019734 [Geosiphon pyriformis]|nr:hypothetical protein G9A89_019734 [Geosiphon pyriformis]
MDQLGHRVDCVVSTKIITADGTTKTPIGKINDFPIEVNGIIVPIKVLVIEVTQYQALVELVLSQNSQHMRVPATCGHFKATNTTSCGLTKNTTSYQAWNTNHDLEEPPIWEWDKREKGKEKVKKEEPLPTASYTPYTYTPPQLLSYH